MARLSRYKQIKFVQVTSGHDLQFHFTRKTPHIMSYDNNVIKISANVTWVGVPQMVFCGLHEICHYIQNNKAHAPLNPMHVMSPQIRDPYLNFTTTDAQWISSLKWASLTRPWFEPKIWYPASFNAASTPNDEVRYIPSDDEIIDLERIYAFDQDEPEEIEQVWIDEDKE